MLVLTWALLFGGYALVCLALGVPVLGLAEHRAPVWLDVLLVAVAAASLWDRLRPVALVGCAVSGFGLLMDAISLVFDQRLHSAPASVSHVLGFAGLVLLAAPRGQVRASSRTARVTAYVGIAALLPYVAMKLTWALGGTFAGLSGAEMLAISRRNGASDLSLALQESGVDATGLLAAVGVVLLVALVRPWGRRLPWVLLLGPALVGAATLAPYGVVGLGVALAVAARAYWTTRSRG